MKSASAGGSIGSHGPYRRKNSSSSATSSGVRCSGSRSSVMADGAAGRDRGWSTGGRRGPDPGCTAPDVAAWRRRWLEQMQERAREIRSRYAEVEASTYGRSWTTEEIDARLPAATSATSPSWCRARPAYDRARTSTRPSPTSWPTACGASLTLANAYDVDLVGAFTSTMDELDEALAAPS